MKILFWNTNKNININPYILSLVQDYNIDILILAEYEADKSELNMLFKYDCQSLEEANTSGCKRINIWSDYIGIESGIQENFYSIQILLEKYVLCCVHLPSKLHNGNAERLEIVRQAMYDIEETEEKIHSKKTIIIGDFNEMPYEESCLNANGFHGLPALGMNDRPTRTVNGKDYRKFYNPMWNLMGDFSYPPGTFYLNDAKLKSPVWYMLDQVIISGDIRPLFIRDSLKIITTCSYGSLINEHKHPNRNISDHFPIMCEIRE